MRDGAARTLQLFLPAMLQGGEGGEDNAAAAAAAAAPLIAEIVKMIFPDDIAARDGSAAQIRAESILEVGSKL